MAVKACHVKNLPKSPNDVSPPFPCDTMRYKLFIYMRLRTSRTAVVVRPVGSDNSEKSSSPDKESWDNPLMGTVDRLDAPVSEGKGLTMWLTDRH